MKLKHNLVLVLLIIASCTQQNKVKQKDKSLEKTLINSIINDEESFYHIDFNNYNVNTTSLPIGVFDSGMGGLTVLKAIVNYDQNNNVNQSIGSDGIKDFNKESFIYLGDQANMPYGIYSKENKVGLLKEHILKDVQFLMDNSYYSNANDTIVNSNKQPVKVLVIACNTATAYGKEHIENFLEQANSDIKVIGVIDAGVQGAFEGLKSDENAIIGVLATEGTVSSKGYSNTIFKFKEAQNYTGEIEVFSQGATGIAEAIDEDPNFFNKSLKLPREEYKGPGLNTPLNIDKSLLDVYNFDFSNWKMLSDTNNGTTSSSLQINDAENYARFYLVSLLEQIYNSGTKNKLKKLILGCTHYPYLTNEINGILNELYHYKDQNGHYKYRAVMAPTIELIDPAINTAKELYSYLNNSTLLNSNGNLNNSEFYISVANKENKNAKIDAYGRFTYDYKYGRKAGEIQEYVKMVPFSRMNISNTLLNRFEVQIPTVYDLMHNFNQNNEKNKDLEELSKI